MKLVLVIGFFVVMPIAAKCQSFAFYDTTGSPVHINKVKLNIIVLLNNHICADCVASIAAYFSLHIPAEPLFFAIKKTSSAILNYNNLNRYSAIATGKTLYLADFNQPQSMNNGLDNDKSPYLVLYDSQSDSTINTIPYGQIFDSLGNVKAAFPANF